VKGKDWDVWMMKLDGKLCWWIASKDKPEFLADGYVKVKLVEVKP